VGTGAPSVLIASAFPDGIVAQILIGAVGSILGAIVIDLALRLFRRMIGWSAQRIRMVSLGAGLVFALLAAVAIGYNWRASQRDEVAQATPEPSVAPATPAPSAETTSSPAQRSTEAEATAVAVPTSEATVPSVETPAPVMTEAPPTFVHVDYGFEHGAAVAALRAYLANEPELLNERNVLLSYVAVVFLTSDSPLCHNGQVSEFDEHRSYEGWQQRVKREISQWRDDVPLTFGATLGTYDFQRRVLPLQLNPQGLLVSANVGYMHCGFTVPVQGAFASNLYYQIAPGTVPQSLAVSTARGEQILNLPGGRNVTVALHGSIQSIDPHFAMNGASGYGMSYQPTEVTIRSGMVSIYHALIRASK
jgi:hypothetical protein